MQYRAFRWCLALSVLALGACTDGEQPETGPATTRPAAVVEDPLGSSFGSLAPPTARAAVLGPDELDGSVVIAPERAGSCRSDYRALAARVSGDGEVRWTADVPWVHDQPHTVVDGALVGWFEGERNGFYRIDLATGEALAQRYVDAYAATALAFGETGAAYRGIDIVNSEVFVESLDLRTLEVRWRSALTEVTGVDDVVVVGDLTLVTEANTAVAFGPDGDRVWEAEFDEEEVYLTSVDDATDVVIARGYPGTVAALDANDGSSRWTWSASEPGVSATAIGARGGTVWVNLSPSLDAEEGANNEGVLALDLETGDELWRVDGARYRLAGSVLVPESWTFFDEAASPTNVLDAATGEAQWSLPDNARIIHDGGSSAW